MSDVHVAATRLADGLVVDEDRDLVRWRDADGSAAEVSLHDYAALFRVPGLYEAVYLVALRGRAPWLLAQALAAAVPAAGRAACRVLDVGAGTGAVGAALAEVGFRDLAATDLEPASAVALERDRPGLYARCRTLDLTRRSAADDRWLAEVAPDVVTVAGAVGFGHLPVEAFAVLTRLLPPGGLLAVTAARDLDREPALAGHARLLHGPSYEQVVRCEGVHRVRPDGTPLEIAALVLRRTTRPLPDEDSL